MSMWVRVGMSMGRAEHMQTLLIQAQASYCRTERTESWMNSDYKGLES